MIGNIISSVMSGIAGPVSKVLSKREDRKKAKISGDAKLALSKIEGEKQITLTDAEWESQSVMGQNNSWKDEYVTIIITLPLVGLLAGGVWLAFSGDSRLLDGINIGIKSLAETGVDMGQLMSGVVFAAVGLKLWRGR